jgi:hypothetical protein
MEAPWKTTGRIKKTKKEKEQKIKKVSIGNWNALGEKKYKRKREGRLRAR